MRKQGINEIKNETKSKLNILDHEKNDILEKLDVNLMALELRCIFCEKQCDFEKERELTLSAKEKTSEIKRLKEEAESNKDKLLDYLLDGENKFSNLLNDLEYERHDALHNIIVFYSIGIKIDKIRNIS